jgi:hypothetical protein
MLTKFKIFWEPNHHCFAVQKERFGIHRNFAVVGMKVYTVALVAAAVKAAAACYSFADAAQTDSVAVRAFAVPILSALVAVAAHYEAVAAAADNYRCVAVAASVRVVQFPFDVAAAAVRCAAVVAAVENYHCVAAAAGAPVVQFPFGVVAAAVRCAAVDAPAENYHFAVAAVSALA